MSSYNNIRKIKYTKNPSDVVSLQEYILFEDSHAKEKYVVFKFSNNLNQRLIEFKFEVLQYNVDNELLEKSTVLHKDFIAEANDLFVPNAKLKLNFLCASLEVRLVSASFDRVIWEDGEFKDNSYKFVSYAETVGKPTQAAKSAEGKKDKDKGKKKKSKLGYNIRNIFRRNKATFPTVFNVFLCIIVVGLIAFSSVYFKRVTNAFDIEGYVVKESSLGYVTILDYTGTDEQLIIPSFLESDEIIYTVEKIAKGAFKRSTAKSIEINAERPLVIETGAFVNCRYLTAVTGGESSSRITFMEGAFTNCKALDTFFVPTAELCAGCFKGTNNIKNFVFGYTVFNEGKLLDIFDGLESITFDYFPLYEYYLRSNPEFVEGVSVVN